MVALPGFPPLPCSRTGRQGMCVAGEGGEWGVTGVHTIPKALAPSLPPCRIRFHSLHTQGMSLMSQKGAVSEPSEWPRLSIVNTIAPQEVIRCYSSFIQLRDIVATLLHSWKIKKYLLQSFFVGNKKEISIWFHALSPSLFLPSGTAGLFSELLSLVFLLTEQIVFREGGRCSFC